MMSEVSGLSHQEEKMPMPRWGRVPWGQLWKGAGGEVLSWCLDCPVARHREETTKSWTRKLAARCPGNQGAGGFSGERVEDK